MSDPIPSEGSVFDSQQMLLLYNLILKKLGSDSISNSKYCIKLLGNNNKYANRRHVTAVIGRRNVHFKFQILKKYL